MEFIFSIYAKIELHHILSSFIIPQTHMFPLLFLNECFRSFEVIPVKSN